MSHSSHAPAEVATPELAGLDENTMADSQEAVAVDYVAGSRPVAVSWISPIYNQRAQEAPQEKRGKK